MKYIRRASAIMAAAAALCLTACATCKSTDTVEQCRTKQRNHSQPRAALAPVEFGIQPLQSLGS